MPRFEVAADGSGLNRVHRDRDRALLAGVAKIHASAEGARVVRETLPIQSRDRGPQQPVIYLLHRRRGLDGVEIAEPSLLIIAANVGVAHPEGAEYAGQTRDVHGRAAKCARDRHAVQRSGAAGCDQGETARVVAAFGGDPFHRVLDGLLNQPEDTRGSGFGGDAQRTRDVCVDRLACPVCLQRNGAAGIRTGLQPPEHKLRVGYRGMFAAEAVAGRPGPGAGAARTGMQHTRGIDMGDRAATRADGVDLDRRDHQMLTIHFQLVGHGDLTTGRQGDVATRAADFDRHQVGGAGIATEIADRAAAGRGPDRISCTA